MSSLTILHFVVFKLVYSEHWGPLISPQYCKGYEFPCYLQDAMGFSFLYQYDHLYPSFYQINVLEDPFEEEGNFFYQKVRDAEVVSNIDQISIKKPSLRLDAEEGRIWRKINREDLTYVLVTPQYSLYAEEIQQNLWNEVRVIPGNTKHYVTGWKIVSKPLDRPKAYLQHDFRQVLTGQMGDYSRGTTQVDVLNWIQTSVSQVMNVDYVATEFVTTQRADTIAWNEILPTPNVQDLVEQQRAFSRSLLSGSESKTKIQMTVKKVLNKIWSYINGIEGITIGDIRDVVVPIVEGIPMSLADRKKNVVSHLNTYKVKREAKKIDLVIPGQVAGDYDTIKAVVNDGNIRERLTLINGYGYIPNSGRHGCKKGITHCESCQAFWDVIFAYSEKDIAPGIELPLHHAKHRWDPFYLQWFNEEDISRRYSVLQQIEADVFADRQMLERDGPGIHRHCMNVRWQKGGDASQMLIQQESAFGDWGKRAMNLRKGTFEQQSRFVKIKDIYPPLSEREKTFIRQAATETKDFYREQIYTKSSSAFNAALLDEPKSIMFLPWWTGFSKFQPNYRMPFQYNAFKLGRLAVSTPSKSSDLMMDIAVSFGLTSKELFFYELGVIGWMGIGPSHSISEVLLGFPYHAAGIHNEYTINKDPYTFIKLQLNIKIGHRASAKVDDYNYESTNNIDMLHSGNAKGYDDGIYNWAMLVVSFVLIICSLCCTCAIIIIIVALITYIAARFVMKGKQRMRDMQQFDDGRV